MRTELIIVENAADHADAMALVERLMLYNDPTDRPRLRAQARLIEDFEQRSWPQKAQSVPDLLAYLMDQHDLTRADLLPLLGGASRVSEVLNGKTGLSMTMIRRLRDRFGIPADLLIPAGGRQAA